MMTDRRLSALAVIAVLIALVGFLGPVAVVVGLFALRGINRSEGRLVGSRVAIVAMLLGACGTVVMVFGTGAILLLAARGRADRVGCQNNLRLLGQGVGVWCVQHGDHFPNATVKLADKPPDECCSWLAALLPTLGMRKEAPPRFAQASELVHLDSPWNDPANEAATRFSVAAFQCPGHPQFRSPQSQGSTHYVGIAGLGQEAAKVSKQDARAGVFGYDRAPSTSDFGAGLAYTLMITETTHDNGPWIAGGDATARGVNEQANALIGPGLAFGGCHFDDRRLSLIEMLYADGSVRLVTDDVDLRVLRAAACLRPSID